MIPVTGLWPDSASLHATFHQLKRKDQVVLYGTQTGQFGALVDYSGRQHHAKHSTVCVKQFGPFTDYALPSGYPPGGVEVPSNILQRILREYKNLSKRVVLTGNAQFLHIATDSRFSLHKSDNLFGQPGGGGEALDGAVTVELNITTLGRILKVTQFGPTVSILCAPNLPVRLSAPIGDHGRVDVFVQQEPVNKT